MEELYFVAEKVGNGKTYPKRVFTEEKRAFQYAQWIAYLSNKRTKIMVCKTFGGGYLSECHVLMEYRGERRL